jgi:AraC-like DNA-binding protein
MRRQRRAGSIRRTMDAPIVEPTFPGVQLLHAINVAARWNVGADAILEGTALTVEALQDPALRVPLSQLVSLVTRIRRLTAEPALGVYLGLATRATLYGYLGFATMTAPSMRSALELAVRFASTVSPAFELQLHERGRYAELQLIERIDLREVRDVYLLATVIGLRTVASAMTGRPATGGIQLAMPRPQYAPRVHKAVPDVEFECAQTRLLFDAASLDLPYVQADPVAMRMFLEHCERLLDASAPTGQLGGRVRSVLRMHAPNVLSIDAAAKAVGMSARTLKRKLALEALSFRQLLDEELHSRALPLLRSDLPLAQIAARLGYSNTANFERAFRRWTGQTPTAFRKRLGAVAL